MISCDFHENHHFAQFWFQALFSGTKVKGLGFCSDLVRRSKSGGEFHQKPVNFTTDVVNFTTDRWISPPERWNVGTLVKFPGCWAQIPGTLGRWAQIPGTLGPNSGTLGRWNVETLERWAPNSRNVGTLAGTLERWRWNSPGQPRTWNQISKLNYFNNS